jgi:hypothetical protein
MVQRHAPEGDFTLESIGRTILVGAFHRPSAS